MSHKVSQYGYHDKFKGFKAENCTRNSCNDITMKFSDVMLVICDILLVVGFILYSIACVSQNWGLAILDKHNNTAYYTGMYAGCLTPHGIMNQTKCFIEFRALDARYTTFLFTNMSYLLNYDCETQYVLKCANILASTDVLLSIDVIQALYLNKTLPSSSAVIVTSYVAAILIFIGIVFTLFTKLAPAMLIVGSILTGLGTILGSIIFAVISYAVYTMFDLTSSQMVGYSGIAYGWSAIGFLALGIVVSNSIKPLLIVE